MSHRKLQQEVDKVFKKINEGLDVFDMYYERHESCTNNPSQKDKLESDLKREVKKLQRLREQIKSWQSSPDIKDKDTLLEHRRRVEIAMEQYKAVEKASKEKAYSNISLKRADTLDPEAKERVETEGYLSQTIDELDRQHELLDVEIDRLQVLNKKKKTHSQANEDKIKDLKALQLRYRWHQQQIELALRLLANEELSPQKVINIKEDINYFVENNQEDDFIEDDTIYDDLDLQSNEAIAHEVSQYYASQISEDNKRTGGDDDDEEEAKPVIIDTLRMSKKELRKLEREQKKAAKLAAKKAADEMMSQGPTLTVKMGSKPLPPLSSSIPVEETITTTTNINTTITKEKATSTTSPNVKKVLESTPSKTQSTAKSVNTSTTEFSSGNAVHTHIHQGINGVTGSTVLKPATIPAKPVGDMKWSTAAAQNIKREDDKPKLVFKQPGTATPIQKNKIKSNDATPTPSSSTTPRLGTPVLSSNNMASNVPLDKMGQLESLSSIQSNNSNTSASSAATAAAVLAAGAAAVNQNNQQFHKAHPVSLDEVNKVGVATKEEVAPTYNELGQGTINIEGIDAALNKITSPTQNNTVSEEQGSESDADENGYYYYSDDDELPEEPQAQNLSIEEIKIIDENRFKLEESYNQSYDLLSLPNGINEFIMGYELTGNKLYANDGKLGGYRHSIDTCKVSRLSEIPAGVNPPNPLDAFRSTQQWDIIRSSIHDDTDFDNILERFRGLEMFSLFYNYYFSVLPIEKKIAFELLREKNWKVGNGETMWFLRQGEVKMQNELFELADYKIFKLDDWSVVDKVNFRLDYANLRYPNIPVSELIQENIEGFEPSTDSTSLSPKQPTSNTASPNSLSHGQQLLQQLKRGKMTN
ncbi:general negative regulator of transcription subunit 3 [Monosporozyma unispora]